MTFFYNRKHFPNISTYIYIRVCTYTVGKNRRKLVNMTFWPSTHTMFGGDDKTAICASLKISQCPAVVHTYGKMIFISIYACVKFMKWTNFRLNFVRSTVYIFFDISLFASFNILFQHIFKRIFCRII